MKKIILAVLCILLIGCATAPPVERKAEPVIIQPRTTQPAQEPTEEECLEESKERIVEDVWKGVFNIDLSFSTSNKIATIDIRDYDLLNNFVRESAIKEQLLILTTDFLMELDERGCINAIDSYKVSHKGYSFTFSKYEVAEATGFADDMDLS